MVAKNKVVVVGDEDNAPDAVSSDRDPEKTPQPKPEKSNAKISDQISHEKLEELAPSGEGAYILDKIDNISEEEAVEIIRE